MPDGGGQTSTTETGPPSYVKPYVIGDEKKGITGVLPEAQRLYESSSPSYFPGSTVAGFNPAQLQSQEMITQRAGMPSTVDAAQGYLGDVMSGKYLNSNPNSDALSQNIWGQVAPRVQGAFTGAGRSGSGLEAINLQDQFTNSLAPQMFNQYNQERGFQQQAAGMAPGLDLAGYQGAGMLGQVGLQQQQQAQTGINADIQRHNFEQNLPQNKLNQYLAAIYGAPGSTSSTSTPGASPLQMLLGGLLGAGGMATGILGVPGVM